MFDLNKTIFKVFKTIFQTVRTHVNISKSEFSRSKIERSKLKAPKTELPNIYQNCQYHLTYNHYSLLNKVQACDLITYDSV